MYTVSENPKIYRRTKPITAVDASIARALEISVIFDLPRDGLGRLGGFIFSVYSADSI